MKTLRNFIMLIFCISIMGSQYAFAQGNSEKAKAQQKKEIKSEAKEVKEEMKENGEEMKEYYKEESKDFKDRWKDYKDKSKAYGKDKDGLEGREFGQARANEAKNMVNNELEVIRDKELLVERGRQRIQTARSRADEAYRNKEITEEEYEDRNEKIKTAEERLIQLQGTIKRGKEDMNEQKRRLSNIYVEKE